MHAGDIVTGSFATWLWTCTSSYLCRIFFYLAITTDQFSAMVWWNTMWPSFPCFIFHCTSNTNMACLASIHRLKPRHNQVTPDTKVPYSTSKNIHADVSDKIFPVYLCEKKASMMPPRDLVATCRANMWHVINTKLQICYLPWQDRRNRSNYPADWIKPDAGKMPNYTTNSLKRPCIKCAPTSHVSKVVN